MHSRAGMALFARTIIIATTPTTNQSSPASVPQFQSVTTIFHSYMSYTVNQSIVLFEFRINIFKTSRRPGESKTVQNTIYRVACLIFLSLPKTNNSPCLKLTIVKSIIIFIFSKFKVYIYMYFLNTICGAVVVVYICIYNE